MKKLMVITSIFILLVGFQNCSEVDFSEATASNQSIKGADLEAPEGGIEIPEVVDDGGNNDLNEDELALYACKEKSDVAGVYICHFPPGNPEALHTLCIGAPALQAHLHHGRDELDEPHDRLGRCEDLF